MVLDFCVFLQPEGCAPRAWLVFVRGEAVLMDPAFAEVGRFQEAVEAMWQAIELAAQQPH